MSQEARGERPPNRVEWPTLAVAAMLYGAFGLVTWNYASLPWWLVLPLGAYLTALHGSLQHEVVHGHPTGRRRLDEALVYPSLWLWLPYRLYRESHLRHHLEGNLTDPLTDPESFYVTPDAWRRAGSLGRAYLWAHNCALGRLVLGPIGCVWGLYRDEIARFARGDAGNARTWLLHLGGAGLVLGWAVGVCGIPFWAYLALFAYPGLSLTLLRSFLEHRAHAEPEQRSVLVEAGPVMALLYLNNNLHALHHAEPGLAWYRLPARYRARRRALLAANGHYFFRHGYLEVLARYLLIPKEPPVHPLVAAPPTPRSAPSGALRQGVY